MFSATASVVSRGPTELFTAGNFAGAHWGGDIRRPIATPASCRGLSWQDRTAVHNKFKAGTKRVHNTRFSSLYGPPTVRPRLVLFQGRSVVEIKRWPRPPPELPIRGIGGDGGEQGPAGTSLQAMQRNGKQLLNVPVPLSAGRSADSNRVPGSTAIGTLPSYLAADLPHFIWKRIGDSHVYIDIRAPSSWRRLHVSWRPSLVAVAANVCCICLAAGTLPVALATITSTAVV